MSTAAALLIAGTTSDAGKSMLVAGLCRAYARRGIHVAPFKGQNMSNNSAVTPSGGEIGRAQALQAEAAGLELSTDFNPVLLKPTADHRSQVIVRGQAQGTIGAADYRQRRAALAGEVHATLARLRARYDLVLCEGAGSPAEVNLRDGDIANMGLAHHAQLPTVVVGDIDRGGVLAHFLGTVAALDSADQRLIAGFIINKFRGSVELLAPGITWLECTTARPVFGVIPYLENWWIDAEDGLAVQPGHVVGRPRPPLGQRWLTVAAVRLPRLSNSTDVEALAMEPGVRVRWVDSAAEIAAADMIIVPGSKATMADRAWLRAEGREASIRSAAAEGRVVVGVCGGFQMLCTTIEDAAGTESSCTHDTGIGLLDADIAFEPTKTVRPFAATLTTPAVGAVRGYEIHYGRVVSSRHSPWLCWSGGTEGARHDTVFGTHIHGLFANDAFRRNFLRTEIEPRLPGFRAAADTHIAAERSRQLDLLADAVEQAINIDTLLAVARSGAPHAPTLRIAADRS